VARWRTRTGRRVLARAVGQQTRQLMQPPRQFLKLLARHHREVGPLDIVQVGVESAKHPRRRILFAPTRKPASPLCRRPTPRHTPPEQLLDPAELDRVLANDPSIKGVAAVDLETST